MGNLLRSTLVTAAALGLFLAAAAMRGQLSGAGGGQSIPSPHEGPTAGQRFKNLQVLKDAPADQIFPAMQFITASLGVECEYCHVHDAFEKDDKEQKQTARKMMTMMFAIDKENFNGRTEVTCYTCHRGSTDPVSTPLIPETEAKPEGEEATASAKPTLPNAGAILDKYVQAIGGAEAVHKITTRVEKGTLTGFGPASMAVAVYAKAPDARVTVVQTPRGENVTAYNGQTGWMSGFGPARPITGGELDNEKRNADFYFAADIKTEFQQIRVARLEKVGDHDAYVLMARSPGHTPVRFYFDKDSGLLLREMRFVETPLGRNPSQVDYGDYRGTGGVKIPYQWTIARPGGRFTIKITDVQQNVPIDESKFAAPSAAGAEPKPGSR